MDFLKPYFDINVIDQIALVTTSGLWDLDFFYKYEQAILEAMGNYEYPVLAGIKDLRAWSIPPLEVTEAFNRLNQQVLEHVDFQVGAILTSAQHLELLNEVIVDFNLDQVNVKNKAFTDFEAALKWIDSKGFNTQNIPLDYFSSK